MLVLNATIDYISSSERFKEPLFCLFFISFFCFFILNYYFTFFFLDLFCTPGHLRFSVPGDSDFLVYCVILYENKQYFKKNLCPKHKASNCNTRYICKKCSGRHHISICQKGNLNSTGGNRGPGIIQQMCKQLCQQRTSTKHQQFPRVINKIINLKLILLIRLLIFQEILTKRFCFKLRKSSI